MHVFKAEPIADGVYWVGAVDWGLREFHGYQTGRGTSYNAFLIIDEHVTLIDTVKAPFKDELLARIASVIDPSKIDYVVSLHSEMDHSGCLDAVIEAVRPQRVFASSNGVRALRRHFGDGLTVEAVEDGGCLDLGQRQLRFVNTPMLHWPDSMFAHLSGADVLFSQDGFGMHLATNERFADQLPRDVLLYEAAKYFANILLPYRKLIPKAVERLKTLQLPVSIIAPDHGPLWREPDPWIVPMYLRWAADEPQRKAVVVYHTMWGSTDRLAHAIAEGLRSAGLEHITLMPLGENHRSDVATELLEAGAVIVGTSTINGQMLPAMADVLCYLEGLKPGPKVAATFGSYGWSGEGAKHAAARLKAMGMRLVADPLQAVYVPDGAMLEAAHGLGVRVAEALLAPAAAPSAPATPSPVAATPAPDQAGESIDGEALFTFTYGMYVVSSHHDGRLNGQISDAVMQVTDAPNQVAVTINKTELTHDCILASRCFTVAVLGEQTPMEVIGRFGFQSGRDLDKFAGIHHARAASGAPYPLEHVIAVVDCDLVAHQDVGSHTLFIGQVRSCRRLAEGRPMTYTYYREVLRGKSPPTAPTHGGSAAPTAPAAPASGSTARCDVCGWIYDPAQGLPDQGIAPGTSFADLPEDFICPICKVGKDRFTVES